VHELHAAFLNESRTRCHGSSHGQEIRVSPNAFVGRCGNSAALHSAAFASEFSNHPDQRPPFLSAQEVDEVRRKDAKAKPPGSHDPAGLLPPRSWVDRGWLFFASLSFFSFSCCWSWLRVIPSLAARARSSAQSIVCASGVASSALCLVSSCIALYLTPCSPIIKLMNLPNAGDGNKCTSTFTDTSDDLKKSTYRSSILVTARFKVS
jgi:hypothetical protein